MISSMAMSSLAQRVEGKLQGKDVAFDHVVIDSREADENALFVAFKGERVDGHDYIEQLLGKGCRAAIVETGQPSQVTQLVVEDSLRALGELAKMNREKFTGKLVALTGSSGKTTTKAMLASILSCRWSVCSTRGNYNNEIGVPLTLLSIQPQHEIAVIEMGARKLGDIAYLCELAQPDVALLLNAGQAHCEVFGSYENTVHAKGEIYENLSPQGVAILNLDDPAAPIWRSKIRSGRVLGFAMQKQHDAALWVESYELQPQASKFTLANEDEALEVVMPVAGLHNVQNALAAAATAIALGCQLDDIKTGLERVCSEQGRLSFRSMPNGLRILDDSYNANPDSMKAALDVLAMQAAPRIAVLGEMAELGEHSEAAHLELAEYVSASQIEYAYFIGPMAGAMAERAASKAQAYQDKAKLCDALLSNLTGKETVLFKGSRVAAMEEIITMIQTRLH